MKMLKKITVAAINGKRGGFIVGENDAPVVVARIFGTATGAKQKDSNFGVYYQFTGTIRAVNADREECASAVMILPSPADSLLADAVAADASGMGVQFAFDIVLKPMPKKSPIDRGYEFVVNSLMDNKATDPMAAFAASLPALAAPAAAAQPALPGTEPAADSAAETTATEKAAKPKK